MIAQTASGWLLPDETLGDIDEPDDTGLFGGTDGEDEITVAEVDAAGVRFARGAGSVIEGLFVLGLLEHAKGPTGLLAALFPQVQGEERDAALFTIGAIVGASVQERRRGRSGGWDPAVLAEVEKQLHEAGFEAMARIAGRAAATFGIPPLPPDTDDGEDSA